MNKELIIRKATREDVPIILALLMDDDLGKLHEDGGLEVYENAFQNISRALRGHGLGTDMIEWAIAQCKERAAG